MALEKEEYHRGEGRWKNAEAREREGGIITDYVVNVLLFTKREGERGYEEGEGEMRRWLEKRKSTMGEGGGGKTLRQRKEEEEV